MTTSFSGENNPSAALARKKVDDELNYGELLLTGDAGLDAMLNEVVLLVKENPEKQEALKILREKFIKDLQSLLDAE